MLYMEEIRELARKYALQNAYTHGGKAQSGSVVSKIFAERPDLKTKAREIVSIVNEVTTQVNSMSLEDQRHELEEKYPHLLEKKKEEKEIKTLPELPNLRGKVVTRFAPN